MGDNGSIGAVFETVVCVARLGLGPGCFCILFVVKSLDPASQIPELSREIRRTIAGSEKPSFYFINRTAILGFRCVRQKPSMQKPYKSRQIGHVLDFEEFLFVHFQGFGTFEV